MGESYNIQLKGILGLPMNYVYAQTFTPLWSHTIERARYWIRASILPSVTRFSLHYLKPDGTPESDALFTHELRWFNIAPVRPFEMVDTRTPAIRLVAGVQYAFLIQTIIGIIGFTPSTGYHPPPGAYKRGKLIRSTDGGANWDTTDRGDLAFAEYGDPPRASTPYAPSYLNFGIQSITQLNYKVNSCVRVTTTVPSVLKCHVTTLAPKLITTYRTTRGTRAKCFDHLTFNPYATYDQQEDCDSLYHTFFIGGLRKGKKYWMTFTGEADYLFTSSQGPIIERTHPDSPPFTATRRPDAPGDICEPSLDGGDTVCPDHWESVNDATPDEDTTKLIGATINQWYFWDLYNIADLPANDRPIDQVHLTGRFRRQGGFAYVHLAKLAVKTHGVIYFSDAYNDFPESYENRHWHLYKNPLTGGSWTYDEINNLQIGIALRTYRGVGWSSLGYCTQLYCRIVHKCESYN